MDILFYSEISNPNCRYYKRSETYSLQNIQFIRQNFPVNKFSSIIFYTVNFSLNSLRNLLKLQNIYRSSKVVVCAETIHEGLSSILNELHIELNLTQNTTCSKCSIDTEINILAKNLVEDIVGDNIKYNNIVNKALDLLIYDISTANLNIISHKLSISSDHLSRIFKRNLGYSFREFMGIFKHEMSKKMLLKYNLDIDYISEKLGYEEVNNFCRFFRSREGMSPNSFRRKNKLPD